MDTIRGWVLFNVWVLLKEIRYIVNGILSRSLHSSTSTVLIRTGYTLPVHVTFYMMGEICYQKPHPWSIEQLILLPAIFF